MKKNTHKEIQETPRNCTTFKVSDKTMRKLFGDETMDLPAKSPPLKLKRIPKKVMDRCKAEIALDDTDLNGGFADPSGKYYETFLPGGEK